MKFSIAGLSLALLGCFIFTAPALASGEGGWTLDLQKDGIDVYTRPVDGSGIKEFKGVAEVETNLENILAVLRDSDRFKTWFPNTPESKLLAREGDVAYQYSVMGTPWPMDDRDNVFRSVTKRDERTGELRIDITAAPDYYPVQDGRVRVQQARGTWKLMPVGPDKTTVMFKMHLEPGGGIPQWMINARIVATPFEALTNLRATAGK